MPGTIVDCIYKAAIFIDYFVFVILWRFMAAIIFCMFPNCHLASGDQQCWSGHCSRADSGGRAESGDTAARRPHHRVRDPAPGW